VFFVICKKLACILVRFDYTACIDGAAALFLETIVKPVTEYLNRLATIAGYRPVVLPVCVGRDSNAMI